MIQQILKPGDRVTVRDKGKPYGQHTGTIKHGSHGWWHVHLDPLKVNNIEVHFGNNYTFPYRASRLTVFERKKVRNIDPGFGLQRP